MPEQKFTVPVEQTMGFYDSVRAALAVLEQKDPEATLRWGQSIARGPQGEAHALLLLVQQPGVQQVKGLEGLLARWAAIRDAPFPGEEIANAFMAMARTEIVEAFLRYSARLIATGLREQASFGAMVGCFAEMAAMLTAGFLKAASLPDADPDPEIVGRMRELIHLYTLEEGL